MPQAGEQSFLIVRLGSLGDLIHTLPAVAALRAGFPLARIDWAVDTKWVPLLQMVPVIDQVIPWRRGLAGTLAGLKDLRGRQYPCAIDFQGLYKSALLARFSGARRRIGFGEVFAREPGASRFYTDRVTPTGRHVAELNLSLAVAAGAEGTRTLKCPLLVPADAMENVRHLLDRERIDQFCVVSPGGGWKSKCWPPERYGALCAELWRRFSIRAIVNAGPAEEDLANAVVAAAGSARPLLFSPSLHELAALVSHARV